MEVPLVEYYKKEFIFRRLLQSFLGGPKLTLSTSAPPYVYIIQISTFILPPCLGYVVMLLSSQQVLIFPATHYVAGVGYLSFFILLRICLAVVHYKTNSVVKLQQNMLSQEDEIVFVSCCDLSTCEFIFSLKRSWLLTFLNLVLALAVTISTTDYLLPEHVNLLFQNRLFVFLIIGFGWFTYATAIYCLAAKPPPEMSSFYDQQLYVLGTFTRPLYLLLLFAVHFCVRLMEHAPDWLIYADYICHIVFCFLPFLWISYMLPPVDALLIWGAEMINIHIMGSCPLTNDLYLLIYLFLGTCLVLFVFFIRKTIGVLIVASIFGYIFSLNFVRIMAIDMFASNTPVTRKPNTSKYLNSKIKADPVQSMENRSQFVYLLHPCKLTIVVLVVIVCHYFINEHFVKVSSFLILGYLNIVILVTIKMASELSKVCFLGGLFKNPIYPVFSYSHKKKWITAIRAIFVKECLPFYLLFNVLTFAKCDLEYSDIGKNNIYFLSTVICITRQLRWVWQSTESALVELMLLFSLDNMFGPTWQSCLLTAKLLILSYIHSVALQVIHKIWMVAIILLESVLQPKQRRPYSVFLFAMNMLFLPVTNCLLLVTSILFSPLMPLFSLPIFMMAFPRPRRFWPHSNNEEIKQCNDAVLYEQVIPQVSQELFLAERKGRLGHLVAGDFLLLRFGDRMLWLYVMESGNDYYVYQMKGLELQETSCHTIEANRIDEIFNSVFNNESSESCLFNPFWFHCLTPLCQITVNSYSDAKNVLTGVIDNPMLVKLVGQLFPKCLVWVIANHSLDIKLKAKMKASVDKSHVVSPVRKRSRPDSSQLLRALPKYKPDEVFLEQSLAADSQIDNVCQINPIVDSPRPSSSSSVIKMNKKAWTNSDLFDATAHTSIIRVEPAKGAIKSSSISSLDSWLEELDGENLSPSSSPRAVQLVAGKERTVPGFLMDSFAPESVIPNNRSPIPVKTKLPALPVFSSNYAMSLAPPVSWYEIPCEFSVIRDRRLFPVDWFHFIIENLFTKYLSISKENHFEKKKNSKELSETLNDEALETVYRKIVVVCVLAINRSLEEGDAFNGARHIHNVFNGDIPWSLKSEWLAGKPELQELVIRAYRYAVKMAIDMVLLGEVSENFPDIVDYLEDFDLNWLMGSHTDESWKESILKEKPTLFSIGYNEMREVFTSHLLTLQPTQINVAYLNGELIRGLWSSLSFELLYLTNDDEERYSIQAHPTILRNLTVQAADPPLGYPIYISEPIFKSVRSWSDLY